MRRLIIAAVGLLPISAFATSSHEHPWNARRAHVTPHERPWNARRAYVTAQELQSSYDFIIAGGGLAGLVLASRLSEDANTTVLVIEAGPTGDDVRSRIDTPVIAYFNGLMRSDYDWKRITTPQPNLGGRNISWPGGRVLGGSSAMNGMYMVRPSALELDAMATVLGGMDGADAWGWNSMYSAMKKSETFTPPSAEIQSEGNILFNAASHGTSGPIHTTYAGFVLPLFGQWGATLGNLGVHVSSDANGGEGWGAFVSTSAINPSNWTRSYSKSAYIDPLPPRANLHIMTNQTVTRLIFDKSSGNLKATGVEYASNGYQQKPWPTVGVNKEVIIAGGPVGSPNILMQSGVGPSDKLTAAGVQVAHALPGVGQHVQDHLSTQVIFRTTAQTTAQLYANGAINGTNNPVASFVNSAIAYTNITDLLGDSASAFKQEVVANMTASANDRALNPSSDPTVTKGYQAVYQATADQILTPAGQVELLLAMTGTGAGQDTFAVQAGIQHPFSTGEVYIATPNPFDYPVINPNYFSHRADVVLLREGIKLARKVGQTQPISNFVTAEVSPGPDVQTDEQVEAWLRTVVSTEFHPSCTCAMLPLDHGGVVDANLKVYGLANVRVADSSVFPLSFAAHLMAPTYGLAEQAAMIIKSEYNGTPSPAALAQTGTATGNSQPTGTSSNDDKDSAGFKLGASPSLSMVFASVLTFLLPAIIL